MLLLLLLLPAGPAAAGEDDAFMARLVARSFFRGLVEGDLPTLAPLCARRVNFDGQVVKGAAAIRRRLEALVTRARERGLRLKKVQLLTYREAVRRFGPPPARIAVTPGRGTMVALAAFQRGGAVAVLGRVGRFWRVLALTD